MKKILIILACFAAIGCATKPIAKSNIPVAPAAAESAKPALEEVRKGIEDTSKDNVKLQENVKVQAEVIKEQKTDIDKAIEKASKIDVSAPTLETKSLVELLNTVKARNLFLENQVNTMDSITQSQQKTLESVRKQQAVLQDKIDLKEAETLTLRQQNEQMATTISAQNGDIGKLQGDLSKSEKKAAASGVYQKWVIALASIIGLIGVGFVALKIWLPSVKI